MFLSDSRGVLFVESIIFVQWDLQRTEGYSVAAR